MLHSGHSKTDLMARGSRSPVDLNPVVENTPPGPNPGSKSCSPLDLNLDLNPFWHYRSLF